MFMKKFNKFTALVVSLLLIGSINIYAAGPLTAPEVEEGSVVVEESNQLDPNDPNVVCYNTDSSENIDLKYGSEIYTVNVRVKGNWELIPDETTSYRDDENLVQYSKYDVDFDEKDLQVILESGDAIDAKVKKVEYSHNESDNYLTCKLIIKYQRKTSDTNNKIWLYKEVSLKVEQLESPILEEIN